MSTVRGTATAPRVKHDPPASELSFSQLLDALEDRLEDLAEGNSQRDGQVYSAIVRQIDDVISRIPGICRRAKNTRNSLVPINRIPPETLALVTTFFEVGCQLINATAVCQHWRTTFLSFPRLWNRIDCSTRTMFKTYLQRSKSAPLEVQVHNTSLGLLEPLVPHISRLSSLTLVVHDSSGFEQLAQYLGKPIPTLNEFSVIAGQEDELKIPSGIKNDHFLHVKKLRLVRLSSFRAPRAFPHVTELVWIVKPHLSAPPSSLLDTVVRLPMLERVEIVFGGLCHPLAVAPPTQLTTLPLIQQMTLRCSDGELPNLLELLALPNLKSLIVDRDPYPLRSSPILPVFSFGDSLPNFAQLPEMCVRIGYQYSKVSFRGPSQATLEYRSELRALGDVPYHHDRKRWGSLPLDSVRKLVVDLGAWTHDLEDVWVVSLLRDLRFLEHLEFRGCCGYMLRYLRRMVMGGVTFPSMKTLTVYSGSKYETRQVHRLKDVVDELGLGISVTWIKECETPDDEQNDPENDGGSEIWDWKGKTEPAQD